MKSISTINPAIIKSTDCSIIKVHASFINLKVDLLLDHYFIAMLHFASSSSNMLVNIPSKELT